MRKFFRILIEEERIFVFKHYTCYCTLLVCMSLCKCTIYIQWLQEEFLPYLTAWESNVSSRVGFTPRQKEHAAKFRDTLWTHCHR